MKEKILFRYGYTDGKTWIFKVFTLDEIQNGSAISYSRVSNQIDRMILTTRDRWTGLTDKNGVKVFEGDKVKHDLGIEEWTSIEWVVVFEFGAFQLKTEGVSTTVSFVYHALTAIENFRIEHQDEYTSHIEVIGNIHEKK